MTAPDATAGQGPADGADKRAPSRGRTALRIFVTGILGLVLLGSAFAYARRTGGPDKVDSSDDATPAGTGA
jgi:hypothetical protein